jgi:hypothetical protein
MAAQAIYGTVMLIVGVVFCLHGVRRMRRAGDASSAPLGWFEHLLTFGLMPPEIGSRRRVEYIASIGEIGGGAVAALLGAAFLVSL